MTVLSDLELEIPKFKNLQEQTEKFVNFKSTPNLKEVEPSPENKYQIPVKVNAQGKILDDDTGPSIIGTIIPGKYISTTHPTGHLGIDYQAPRGTPVYAIGPGTVVNTSTEATNPKGGNSVSIKHDNDTLVSYYAHLDSVRTTVGQKVDSNSTIGTIGDSGNAKTFKTSTHLHFQTKLDGKDVDPLTVIGKQIGFSKKADSDLQKLEKLAQIYWQASQKL